MALAAPQLLCSLGARLLALRSAGHSSSSPLLLFADLAVAAVPPPSVAVAEGAAPAVKGEGDQDLNNLTWVVCPTPFSALCYQWQYASRTRRGRGAGRGLQAGYGD